MKIRFCLTVCIAAAILLAVSQVSAPLPAQGNQTASIRLVANDGAPYDDFGSSVAISGNFIVVGAPGDSSGSSYIFERSGESWSQIAKLGASNGGGGSRFGKSVAISGNTVVVGAPGYIENGKTIGAAYVFRYESGSWLEEVVLHRSSLENGAFGESVAIDGNTIVIGSPGYRAYVFVKDNGVWIQEAVLGLELNAEAIGTAVSISNDVVILGNMGDDEKGTDAGSAYVYRRATSRWDYQAKIFAPDGKAHDYFGASLSVLGNNIIVGAVHSESFGPQSGAVYIGTPADTDKIVAIDGARDDFMGASTAIGTLFAVAGANGADGTMGAAHLMQKYRGKWSYLAKLVAGIREVGAYFGSSVAIDNSTVVVGSPAEDVGNNENAGTSYVYEASDYFIPTSVELKEFTHYIDNKNITLSWTTNGESPDNSFSIYRATHENGNRQSITPTEIPAYGIPTGYRYSFTDSDFTPGIDYYYWLEVLPERDSYGPLFVTFGGDECWASNCRVSLPLVFR